MASWTKNPKKIDLGPIKKLTKKSTHLGTLKNHLLVIKMEGFGGAKRGPQKCVLEVFFGLGRVLGPRWPQDPSRILPRLIFLDLGIQLDGF